MAFAGSAGAAVTLGWASGFAVLGGSTVTNTGATVITGQVGVSPGSAITGFPPGTVTNGSLHSNDALAILAHDDAQATFNSLASMAVTLDLSGQDLGGMTLTPGVYSFSSSAQLTGTLTLDGLGQVDPVFVFLVGSTLTTASGAGVDLLNGADGQTNVFFRVGDSTTLGTNTEFAGTILSANNSTLTTGASVEGRVISLSGAVTLDTNSVTVPEPGAAVLLLGGLAMILGKRRRSMANAS